MDSLGLAPRLAAARLVNAVTIQGHLLSEKLPMALEKLTPEDRARAGRLAHSCLRWMDRSDRILGPHLRKRPPPEVLNVLRLAVVEICQENAAPHGVVNSAVEIVQRQPKGKSFKGLVNAVLRNVATDGIEKWSKLPPPQLPKWLRKPLIGDFGKATISAIELAHSKGAPLDITPKSDPDALATALGGIVLPTGSVRIDKNVQVTSLPGYEAGDWWVQDGAAALPAKLLAVKKGERVLDLCAAPGGKTMQLAAAGGAVTALDISAARMKRVQENLDRTGLSAELIVGDVFKYQAKPFDAILLDAPCSATGTIRRHPDLPYAKNSEGFQALFEMQEKMLDHALSLLAPGGRLVFCTCSLLIDEGDEQIKDALGRHPGLRVMRENLSLPGVPGEWCNEFGIRTRPDFWPELGGMDGFFMTILQKPAG